MLVGTGPNSVGQVTVLIPHIESGLVLVSLVLMLVKACNNRAFTWTKEEVLTDLLQLGKMEYLHVSSLMEMTPRHLLAALRPLIGKEPSLTSMVESFILQRVRVWDGMLLSELVTQKVR